MKATKWLRRLQPEHLAAAPLRVVSDVRVPAPSDAHAPKVVLFRRVPQ